MIVDLNTVDQSVLLERIAEGVVNRRAELTASEHPVTWDRLSDIGKVHVKEAVLPIVVLTLAGLKAHGEDQFDQLLNSAGNDE